MTKIASRLLRFHQANPSLARFPLLEMAAEGFSIGELDQGYLELLNRGLVQPSGKFHLAGDPPVSRETFKLTSTGRTAYAIALPS